MKQLSITLFFITTLFVLVFQQTDVFTNIVQPNPGNTGAPGESTTCAQSTCHGGTAINVTGNNKRLLLGEISGNNLANGYAGDEGETLNMQVSFNQNLGGTNFPAYGFSLTALFADGTPAGTIMEGNGTNADFTSLVTSNNKQYLGHQNANSRSNWVFKYQLPQTINQDIIFYIAGNGANGDTTKNGDQIFLAQYRLSEDDFGINQDPETSVPLNIADVKAINVFPNPVVNELNLQFSLDKGGFVTADLLDLKGSTINRLFSANMNTGNFNKQFAIGNELNSGIYLVRIQMNEQEYYQKVLVQ